MIRLVVDATSATERISGLERYTRETVTSLASLAGEHDFTLEVLLASRASWIEPAARTRLHESVFPSRLATEQVWIPSILRRLRADIAFFPAFPPSPLVFASGLPVVKTVHDAVLWKHSDTTSWKARFYFRPQETFGIHRYRSIHTVSTSSAVEIAEIFPRAASRIVVSGNGVDLDRFSAAPPPSATREALSRLGLSRPYVLAVGTIEPRKNYPFLVDAIRGLVDRGCETDLVFAGRPGWGQSALVEELDRSGLGARAHLLGPVDEGDLPHLYRSASLLAIPSVQEGFGLPVIEAMAAGTPVAASDLPSLREVSGGAALLIPQNDREAWIAGLERLIHDEALRSRLILAGEERAKEFGWSSVAKRILDDVTRQLAR